MTREEAVNFFSEFYFGEHHIPSEVKPFGNGFSVLHHGDLASYDFNGLTRLVVMAHDKCIRVSILPCNMQHVKICIHQRIREGDMMVSHPTLADHIERINKKS